LVDGKNCEGLEEQGLDDKGDGACGNHTSYGNEMVERLPLL